MLLYLFLSYLYLFLVMFLWNLHNLQILHCLLINLYSLLYCKFPYIFLHLLNLLILFLLLFLFLILLLLPLIYHYLLLLIQVHILSLIIFLPCLFQFLMMLLWLMLSFFSPLFVLYVFFLFLSSFCFVFCDVTITG